MNAALLFKLAGLLLSSGQTAAVMGDIIPLEATLVPLIENAATWASTIDALAASDAAAIQAEAQALCGLIQVAAKLLADPKYKAATADLLKSLHPSKTS